MDLTQIAQEVLAFVAAEGIELSSDKLRLCQHLSRHSLPTLPTTRFDVFAKGVDYPFPIVVKPRDGAGSVNTFLIRDAGELRALQAELAARLEGRALLTPSPSPARGEGGRGRALAPVANAARGDSEAVVQPFVPGRPLSTAALIDDADGRIEVLPVGEQRLTSDGRFGYRGGRIPAIDLPPELASAAVDLVTEACRSVPGLAGFVGFDLIASPEPPHVRIVEINPRLTTSYVGYRRLTRENLAARMLGLVGSKLAKRALAHQFVGTVAGKVPVSNTWWASAHFASSAHPTIEFVEFDADGTVRVS